MVDHQTPKSGYWGPRPLDTPGYLWGGGVVFSKDPGPSCPDGLVCLVKGLKIPFNRNRYPCEVLRLVIYCAKVRSKFLMD